MTDSNNVKKQEFKETGNESMKIESVNELSKFENNLQKTELQKQILCQDTESITFDNFQKDNSIKGLLKSASDCQVKTTNSLSYEDQLNVILKKSNLKSKTIKLNNVVQNILTSEFDHLKLPNNYQRNSNQNDVIPYNYNNRMIERHLSRDNDNSFCSSSTRTVNSTSMNEMFCDDVGCRFSKHEILNCNFDNSIQSNRSSRISDMLQKLSKGMSHRNRRSESSEANNHDYAPSNNADLQEESSDKDEDNEVNYLDENDEEILYKLSQLNPGLTTQIIKETIKTVEEIYQEVSGSVSEDPDEHETHSNSHIRPLVEQKFSEIIEKAISNSIGHPSFENTVNIENQSLKSLTKFSSMKSHSHSSQSKKSSLKESIQTSPKLSLQNSPRHSNLERNEVLPILNELDKLPFDVVEDYVSYKSASKRNSSVSKKSSLRSENVPIENIHSQDVISEQVFENSYRSQPKYSEYHQELPQLNQSVNRHSNHSKCRRSVAESSCHHNEYLKPHCTYPEIPISPHPQCPCTTNVSININQDPPPRVSVSTPDTCLSNSPNQKILINDTSPYSQCSNTYTQTHQSIPQMNSPNIQTEPCISKPNIKQFCDKDDDDNTEELLKICRKYLRRKNDTRPSSPRSSGYGVNEIPRINQIRHSKTDLTSNSFQNFKPNIGIQTIKTDFNSDKYFKTENSNYHYHPCTQPNSLNSKMETNRLINNENCDEYPKQNNLKKSKKIDSNNFPNLNKTIPIIRTNFDMDYHNKCCGLYSQNNKVPTTSLFKSRDIPTVSATCNRSTFASNIRRTSPIIVIGNKKLEQLKRNGSEKSRDDFDDDNDNDAYNNHDDDDYDNDDTNPSICNLYHKSDKIFDNYPNKTENSNIDGTKENKKEQYNKIYQEECRNRSRQISESNIKLSSKLNEHKIRQNNFKMMNCRFPVSKSIIKNYGNEFCGIGSKLSGNFGKKSFIKEEEKNISKINPKLFDKKFGDNITRLCRNQRENKIIGKKSLEKIFQSSRAYDKNISKSKYDIRNDKLKEHISKAIRNPQRKSSENGIENLRQLSNPNFGRKSAEINSKSYQHRSIGKVIPDSNLTSPSSGSSLKSESINVEDNKPENKTLNFQRSEKMPTTCDKSLVTDETENNKMAIKSTNTEPNYFKTASSYSSTNYSIRPPPQDAASITQLPSLGGDRFYSINISNDKLKEATDNPLNKMDIFQLLNNIYPTSFDPNWINNLFQNKFSENSAPYYLYNVKKDNSSNYHGPNGEIFVFPHANFQMSNRKELDMGLEKHPSNTTNTTTNDNIANYTSSTQHNLEKPWLVPNKDKLITFSSSVYDDRKNSLITKDNSQLFYNSKPLNNISESQHVRLVNRTENNVSGVGGHSSTSKSGTPQYSYKFEENRDPKTGTLETREFSKLTRNDPLTNLSKTRDKSVKEVTYVNESYEPKEFVNPDELKDELKDELSPLKSSSRSQSRKSRKNKRYSKTSRKTVDKTIITRNSEGQLDTRNSEIKNANEKKLRDISMKLEIPIVINSRELEERPNSRGNPTGCCEPEPKCRYPPVRVMTDCSDDNDYNHEYKNVICDMNDSDFDDEDDSGGGGDDSLLCTTGNDVINDLGYLSNPYIQHICHGTNCCPNHTIYTCFP